ncbi:hypothetical protein ARTHRO9AX_180053 [Arthrobacter sp. 9AX]|nr:hypothetical protein ARTHRO9AX_180053 [Arthrobacter sp. 9AX]
MLLRSAWIPAPPDGSEPAMDSTRGTGRPGAAGGGKAAGDADGVAVGIARVADKRHPFAGASRTGSTGVDLSRPSARHPVSVPQPSFFGGNSPKVTEYDHPAAFTRACSRCGFAATKMPGRPLFVASRAFSCSCVGSC